MSLYKSMVGAYSGGVEMREVLQRGGSRFGASPSRLFFQNFAQSILKHCNLMTTSKSDFTALGCSLGTPLAWSTLCSGEKANSLFYYPSPQIWKDRGISTTPWMVCKGSGRLTSDQFLQLERLDPSQTCCPHVGSRFLLLWLPQRVSVHDLVQRSSRMCILL